MTGTPPGDGPGEPGPAGAETPVTVPVPAEGSGRAATGWELPGGTGSAWELPPGSAPARELPAASWPGPAAGEQAAGERAGAVLTADDQPPAGGPVTAGLPGDPPPADGRGRLGRFPARRGPREAGGRGRRPRGRTRWRTAFFVVAALAVVAGVSWALFGDRLLVVRSVAVSGTRLVAPQQVLDAAAVPVGTPLATVDSAAVIHRVEMIRQVASARVSKDWPDRLVITVTERVPVMGVKMAGGGYDLVDKSGVIVRWAAAKPTALPQLSTTLTGSALAGSPAASTAAGVLAELQPALAKQVKQVRPETVASGTEQVTLDLRSGQTVQWGGTDDAAQKNRELTVLLPGGARHIDVSSPGTVVTR
jgi:cell division protein FtsQ